MSKNIKLGNSSVTTVGRFKLEVNRDKTKFSVTNINAFVPYGKSAQDRMMFLTPSGERDSLMIDKIITTYKPDENDIDLHNISVFIQHDDVRIGGMTDEEHQKLVQLNIKRPNCKFTLTNIDKVQTAVYDHKVKLIQARGLLFAIEKPLSKERLIWLCSSFGLAYRSNVTDEKRYKIELSNSIDTYLQSNEKNIETFMKALENIKFTEMRFYINELKSLGIITDIGGLYKVGNRPTGATDEHIMNYYDQNAELFLEHQKLVKESLANTVMA